MIKNIFRVLVSNFLVILVGFINSIVFPKLLSINDYAVYQTFMLYLSYTLVLSLGLSSGLFIKYGGRNYHEIDQKAYKSEIILLFVILLLFTIIGVVSAIFFHNKIVLYISLCIVSLNFVVTYKFLYQAWNKFKIYSVINGIIPISISGLALLFWLVTGNLKADFVIAPYLIVNGLVCLYLLGGFYQETLKVKVNKIFSSENFALIRIGFFVMLGNFINILIHSLDRFFVKALFSSYEFAIYSFAMSLQTIMTIFITAIAQPLYPQLVAGKIDEKKGSQIKEILILFGSLSGCAYFVCALIIKWLLPKYLASINIIAIFFVVFPAMAIINCLYINLYKATRQIKRYIVTLVIIIGTSFLLNGAAVLIYKNYLSLVVSTTVTYYIWLWYSARHFTYLKLKIKEVVYLLGFFTLFYLATAIIGKHGGDLVGLAFYLVGIILLIALVYGKTVKEHLQSFLPNTFKTK